MSHRPFSASSAISPGRAYGMYLTGTPSRAATAAAMSGETPEGSPFGSLPLTKRKFPMLIAARKTPVGASSETICGEACTGIGGSVREGEGRGILEHDEVG